MDVTIDEFPFVSNLPKREKGKVAKAMDLIERIKDETQAKGALVPVRLAAVVLGVSRTRIDMLASQGKLERVEIMGHPYITESTLVAHAKSERKAGRPSKSPTIKEAWAVCREHGKEVAKSFRK